MVKLFKKMVRDCKIADRITSSLKLYFFERKRKRENNKNILAHVDNVRLINNFDEFFVCISEFDPILT